MEMNDEIRLQASRETVWNALNDTAILKVCIPGCETLEKTSDTEFVSLVVAKVGPIKAKFSGKVTLSDIVPLVSYKLTGEGQGGVAGFAKADITLALVEESPGVTLLRYGVNAAIGGKLAQLGSRLIDSTARKMADQFFISFEQAVCGQPEAVEAPAPVAATPASHGSDITVTLVDVLEEADFDYVAPTLGVRIAQMLGIVQAAPAPAAPPRSAVKYQAALVTLNRPRQKNAVSLAMWRDLGRIFTELGADPQVRAIILTGAGDSFSAGADISEFGVVRASLAQGVDYEIAVDACCDAIAATPKPTIAAIRGFCMGGACHLAMSCDFRIGHPSALFAIPAARLSIVYGVRATQRLLALVGIARAKHILYSAKKFNAQEALRIGFVEKVSSDPLRAARSFAAVMADNAPLTIAGTKVLLNGLTMDLGILTEAEVNAEVERAVSSEDYANARQAFVEKRAPVFVGK